MILFASRILDFYESGCPAPGEPPETAGTISGEAGQEIWCGDSSSAHNIVVSGIEADGMVITLFSDKLCTAVITTIDTDGCKVIPSDVRKFCKLGLLLPVYQCSEYS